MLLAAAYLRVDCPRSQRTHPPVRPRPPSRSTASAWRCVPKLEGGHVVQRWPSNNLQSSLTALNVPRVYAANLGACCELLFLRAIGVPRVPRDSLSSPPAFQHR